MPRLIGGIHSPAPLRFDPTMRIGTAPRTFQELIFALQRYWSERGCVVLQPYDMEVGAGTFHTATFLRAIGPEPWSAAYVQPSRRPTDGRYGENPFRLQHYYQFQVVIKPSPLDILELYLDSLRALGFDPRVHDVRFVEDNWESPDAGRLGPRLGGVAERHGDHPVHLLPAGRRARTAGRSPARSPMVSSAWRCTCRASRASSTSSGRDGPPGASPTATCSTRTRSSSRATTSSTRTSAVLLRHFDDHEQRLQRTAGRETAAAGLRAGAAAPRTPSICSMRGARSR